MLNTLSYAYVFVSNLVLAKGHGGGGGSGIDTHWIKDVLILKIIAPLLLAMIGVGIIATANKGKFSKTANTGAIALIGVIFIVAAGALIAFADTIGNHVFTG